MAGTEQVLVPDLGEFDDVSGVIELGAGPASTAGRQPFVHAPVAANDVPTGAERQPVQIDAHRSYQLFGDRLGPRG